MRTIKVYAEEIQYVKDGQTKTFTKHTSAQPNKNDKNQTVYFNVDVTKRCEKKLPDYHCEITFDVSKSYFIRDVKEINGKKYENYTLWLDDFEITNKLEKKITTEEDLPF